jgi:hypothetical protein
MNEDISDFRLKIIEDFRLASVGGTEKITLNLKSTI